MGYRRARLLGTPQRLTATNTNQQVDFSFVTEYVTLKSTDTADTARFSNTSANLTAGNYFTLGPLQVITLPVDDAGDDSANGIWYKRDGAADATFEVIPIDRHSVPVGELKE